MGTRKPLDLTDAERDELRTLVRRPRTPRALADRCRVVLLDDEGLTYAAIGARIDMREQTVLKWRTRFLTHRVAGLRDAPRPGVQRKITDEMVAEVVRMTLEEKPPDATHWSLRSMAAASGISRSSVNTIWRAFNLQPHRSQTFKLSTDPRFVEKTRDIVGLYMSPPQNAVVICVDEKSQMQALDRTQPLLPMRPGSPERRTHDYYRHGTSSLFAALMVKTGVVIGECHRRHRHQEFIKFLSTIDGVVKATEPVGTAVHIVLDNYATHKTPAVQRWLAKHPEYHLHFTPTSASWLNQVERVFADLTEKQLRRGVFTSVASLEHAALGYIDARNDDAKPFVWTADADTILGRVAKNRATSSKSGH
ncbi:MAG: IS630 family transposase [Phycisphaeraceae bacterium]|nr:IS630 family transposase [Phycisphaeraceae bacterium]MBX3315760.1 IS630 family transposase [Phycisphaeraceae bacterium]